MTARRRATGLAIVLAASLLSACMRNDPDQNPSTTPTASSSAPTPTPTPSTAVNPLTGLPPVPTGTVVIAKIDDSLTGHPQIGVEKADVVYVEETEGGISRLAAVFATHKPTVGYVRSARGQDPELFGAYGQAMFVASGGVENVLRRIDRSALRRLDADHFPQWFVRHYERHEYVNVTSDLAAIDKRFPGGAVRDVGFEWGPQTGGKPARAVRTVVGQTTMSFVWDGSLKRYVRMIGDARYRAASGELVATPNVVVLNCRVAPDGRNVDVTGARSMYTHTVGAGKATVFRDGKRIDGTWQRTDASSKLTLTSRGTPIRLAPGGAWVLLARTTTAVESS